MALSKTIVYKQPAEERLVSMTFQNKMADNENINGIDSIVATLNGNATVDLTFANQTWSGDEVQFLISGGNIPTREDINYCDYKVTVTVTTDLGQTLEK